MIARIILAWIALSVNLLLLASVHAAPEQQLSLQDAMELVLANNPNFRVYQLRQQAIQGELQSAELDPAWQLAVEAENFLGSNELQGFSASEWTLTLGRVIERGDKRQARSNVVRRRQEIIDTERQLLELDLLSEAASRFIELATLQEKIIVLNQARQLAEEVLSAVNNRTSAGLSPQAEYYRAQAELSQAELAITTASFAMDAAREQLRAFWGGQSVGFSSVLADFFELQLISDIEPLLSELRNSPALSVYTDQQRLLAAELALATAQQAADFSVAGGIKYASELGDAAFVAEFSMPLQTKRRSRGAMTTAQANLLRVESEEQAALYRLQGQLQALVKQHQSASNRYEVLQAAVIPSLQQALEETRVAYQSGLYGYVELSAAQQDLIQAELNRIDAAAQAHLMRIEIERLSGQLITGSPTAPGETP